jgi:hemolysin activation/secretion protein
MRVHESISLAYATVSPPKELQYVSLNYRQVLNSEGLNAFFNGSYSWGHPGTPTLEELDFHTRSTYAEAGAQYPIIRSRERNLYIVGLAFAGENYNLWNLTPDAPQAADRLRGVRVRLEGDFADKTLAITQAGVTVSQGIDGLGSTSNDNTLASRLGGRVDFTKVEILASRLQPLMQQFSAFVAGYAQYTRDPLLVPEQCGFGGRVFGRAYDPSELLGDSCWMVLGELRFDLPIFGTNPGSGSKNQLAADFPAVQVYGFTDKGKLYRLAVASVGTAADTFTGASAGGGIRLRWQNYLDVDLSAAKAVEGPRDGWRFFFITTARY